MRPVGSVAGDRGETLVEVLVAIAIVGLAATAILAGVQLSIKASDLNRKEATSGAYVRSAAEAIQNYIGASKTNYQSCATANWYSTRSSISLPTSYTLTQDAAQAWNGSSWVTCTSALDKGVQRVLLTVTSPGTGAARVASERLYLILRKPCNGTLPSPC